MSESADGPVAQGLHYLSSPHIEGVMVFLFYRSRSFALQAQQRLPEQNPTVAALYSTVAANGVGSESARRLFHTQYHRREKTVTASVGDW